MDFIFTFALFGSIAFIDGLDISLSQPIHNSQSANITEIIASNTTTRKYAYLYENLRRYFLSWYLPCVICLGTLGTLFCLLFLFVSRLFPHNMLLWLVSICIGDFLILMLEGTWMMLKSWYKYDIRDINDVSCIIHISLSNYILYWSAYMQSMFSVQRAYLVIRPMHARNSGPKFSTLIKVWVFISILLILPVLPYMLYWRVVEGDCDPEERVSSLYRATTLCDFIVWGLVPLFAMVSSTTIITWNVFRIRRQLKYSSDASRGSSKLSMSTNRVLTAQQRRRCLSTAAHLPAANDRRTSQWASRTRFRSIDLTAAASVCIAPEARQSQRHGAADNAGHVTRLLICMNIWYTLSTFPLMSYLMLLNFVFGSIDPDLHRFLYYLGRSLCFLNACSNWIFYCASGKTFQRKSLQMIRQFFRRVNVCSRSANSGNAECNNQVTSAVRQYNCVKLCEVKQKQSKSNYNPYNAVDTNASNTTTPLASMDKRGVPSSSNKTSDLICMSSRSKHSSSIKLLNSLYCQCICPSSRPEVVDETELSDRVTTSPCITGTLSQTTGSSQSSRINCTKCLESLFCWRVWCYASRSGAADNTATAATRNRGAYPQSLSSDRLHRVGAKRHRFNTTQSWAGERPSQHLHDKADSLADRPTTKEVRHNPIDRSLARSQQNSHNNASSGSLSSKCYCYISSHGRHRFHYHYCDQHAKMQATWGKQPQCECRQIFDSTDCAKFECRHLLLNQQLSSYPRYTSRPHQMHTSSHSDIIYRCDARRPIPHDQ